jgi:hypothetical protein
VREHQWLGGTKMHSEVQTSSQSGVNSGIDKNISVEEHICQFDPFDYATDFFGNVITTCEICGRCVNRGFFR